MKRVALVVSAAIVCLVSIIKNYWTYIGGFMGGDEALYFHGGLLSVKYGKLIAITTRHQIFQLTTIAATFALNLDNVFKFVAYMLVHCVFWNILCLYILFKLLCRVTEDDRAASLTLLSVPFILVYTVLNGMYLSEAPSLFFCLLGINLMLRFTATPTKKTIFLASSAFVISSLYREPFLVFIAMNLGLLSYWIIRHRARWTTLLLFMLPLIVLPFPTSVLGITELPEKSLLDMAIGTVSDFQLFSPIPVSEYESQVSQNPVFQYWPSDFPMMGLFTSTRTLTERIVMTAIVFGKGMVFGWSCFFTLVLFLGLASFSLHYWKQRNRNDTDQTVLINILASLLSFALLAFMLSPVPYVGTEPGSSICLRFSYSTLPAVICFPHLYERITRKRLYRSSIAVAVIAVPVLMVLLFPHIAYALQSNQSLQYVNRLDLSYRGPYYRLYEYILSRENEKLAVFVDPAVRASLYVWMTDADLYRMMVDEVQFTEILGDGYDAVLFYGEKWYGYYDMLRDNSPFYLSLIQNQTQHRLTVVWDDAESHLYRLEVPK